MQTNECQIKTMERSDFRPWTLMIPCWILDIPELFYAAVAAGFAPGKPLFSIFSFQGRPKGSGFGYSLDQS
jgi:hypothetical protein